MFEFFIGVPTQRDTKIGAIAPDLSPPASRMRSDEVFALEGAGNAADGALLPEGAIAEQMSERSITGFAQARDETVGGVAGGLPDFGSEPQQDTIVQVAPAVVDAGDGPSLEQDALPTFMGSMGFPLPGELPEDRADGALLNSVRSAHSLARDDPQDIPGMEGRHRPINAVGKAHPAAETAAPMPLSLPRLPAADQDMAALPPARLEHRSGSPVMPSETPLAMNRHVTRVESEAHPARPETVGGASNPTRREKLDAEPPTKKEPNAGLANGSATAPNAQDDVPKLPRLAPSTKVVRPPCFAPPVGERADLTASGNRIEVAPIHRGPTYPGGFQPLQTHQTRHGLLTSLTTPQPVFRNRTEATVIERSAAGGTLSPTLPAIPGDVSFSQPMSTVRVEARSVSPDLPARVSNGKQTSVPDSPEGRRADVELSTRAPVTAPRTRNAVSQIVPEKTSRAAENARSDRRVVASQPNLARLATSTVPTTSVPTRVSMTAAPLVEVWKDVSSAEPIPQRAEPSVMLVEKSTVEASEGRAIQQPSPALLSRNITNISEALVRVGRGEVEVLLDPEELGSLRLRVSNSTSGGVLVSIIAERAETAELIRRNLDMLLEELAHAGLESAAFEFRDPHGGDQRALEDGRQDSLPFEASDPMTPNHNRPAEGRVLDLRL